MPYKGICWLKNYKKFQVSEGLLESNKNKRGVIKMKNVMMVAMFLFSMLALGPVSFAEDAKAPAAVAAPAAPAVASPAPVAAAPVVAPVVEPKAEEALSMEHKVQEITEPPQWMKAAIAFALKMPYVGPILVQALQWMGVVSALLTALAGLLLGLGMLLQKLGKSISFLVKIKDFLDKVYPYVAWLSMLNVQKKPEDEKKAA